MGILWHVVLFSVVYVHFTAVAICAGKGLHSVTPRFISHEKKTSSFIQIADGSSLQRSHVERRSEDWQAGDSGSLDAAEQKEQQKNVYHEKRQWASRPWPDGVPVQGAKADAVDLENYKKSAVPAQTWAVPERNELHTDASKNWASSASVLAVHEPLREGRPDASYRTFSDQMSVQTFKKLLLLLMLGSETFSRLAADSDHKSVADIIRANDAGELENLEFLLWEAYQHADEPEEVTSIMRHLKEHIEGNSRKKTYITSH